MMRGHRGRTGFVLAALLVCVLLGPGLRTSARPVGQDDSREVALPQSGELERFFHGHPGPAISWKIYIVPPAK